MELAQLVADTVENNPSKPLQFTYKDTDSVQQKIEKIATGIYGASIVTYSSA
ncbi:MAG: formate--tetrahydrofolate ligase [Bacteroides graminisolvens]